MEILRFVSDKKVIGCYFPHSSVKFVLLFCLFFFNFISFWGNNIILDKLQSRTLLRLARLVVSPHHFIIKVAKRCRKVHVNSFTFLLHLLHVEFSSRFLLSSQPRSPKNLMPFPYFVPFYFCSFSSLMFSQFPSVSINISASSWICRHFLCEFIYIKTVLLLKKTRRQNMEAQLMFRR